MDSMSAWDTPQFVVGYSIPQNNWGRFFLQLMVYEILRDKYSLISHTEYSISTMPPFSSDNFFYPIWH
jgi:hypothetical protein